MAQGVWGIKLGSAGKCVPFCEKHKIVGIGWQNVDSNVVRHGDKKKLRKHIEKVCAKNVGRATGTLFRFGVECALGDYILYYHPSKKRVQICRVKSKLKYRDFDVEQSDIDIWQYRDIEYTRDPISILDLYGSLKGKLLGPRGSFWGIRDAFAIVDFLARGKKPGNESAPDREIREAFDRMTDLVLRRAEALNERDWELVVADYFRAQGAYIEGSVGGGRPIIDAEARFSHGELGEEVWRIQVKRLQDKPVGWAKIEKDYQNAGDDVRFCFVSVYGFTDEARAKADAEGIRLMEAADFTRFLFGERLRPDLRIKLALPGFGAGIP